MLRDTAELISIDELRFTNKADLPVSIIITAGDMPIIVSRYAEPIWDFSPYFPQDNLKSGQMIINWEMELPDGVTLTNIKHARLLESAKDFTWSLFAAPLEGRKRPTMATLVARFDVLRPLLRWMVSLGLNQFRQLDGRTMNYVSYARMHQVDKRPVSASTLHYRLNVLENLFRQRNKIKDALTMHPWPHESSVSLSGVKRSATHRKPTTPIIPDKIATELARVAISYIDHRYSEVSAAIRACKDAGDELLLVHRQTRTNARTRAAKQLGFSGVNELMRIATHIRTACYIVIDMFSGIRDSEMMSLEEDCISRSVSPDGSSDITWLHGTIYKTGTRPKKWIVPDVVARAVFVLTDLTSGMRRELNEKIPRMQADLTLAHTTAGQKRLAMQLNKAQRQRHKLFLCRAGRNSTNIGVISGHMQGAYLKLFCAEHGITEAPGVAYNLHAHQFRRTYARFAARAELGDLLALREHFGHTSLDMTTHYVDGATNDFDIDTDLLNMVNEEKNSRQGEIIKNLLLQETPLANGTHWLKDWRSAVRTATNKEQLIAEYAGTLTINGTGHSWCIGNAKGIGCGGFCIFEAQMCVDCHYGIIGPEHRAIWEGIRNQQIEVLALNDIGPGGLAKATQILRQAEKVLARLDGAMP